MRSIAQTAGILAATCGSAGALWSEHTFVPPFNSFDGEGMRKVEGWRIGGSAAINENFLRLTPDRQSKRGFIWNSNRLDADRSEVWSSTIRFRTSGQGKRLFGDGLAFWATNHASHRDGNLHGFTDSFRGFGIVLDTFVNNEAGHVHKDIQIVSSDGAQPRKLDDKPVGCDADFRFWEGRDDFSVSNHSAVRVRFAGGRVSVWVDSRGAGQWSQCITDAEVSAPAGWAREGIWIGLTASTGDVADNHDVLSVQIGDEDAPAPAPANLGGLLGAIPEFIPSGDARLDESIRSAAGREAGILAEKFTFVQHSLEHQLSAITDSLKAALKKVQEQENESEKRIDELERKIRERIEQSVGEKMDKQLDSSITTRLAKLEGMVSSAVNTAVNSAVNTAVNSAVSNNIDDKLKRDVMPALEKATAAAAGLTGLPMWVYGALAVMAIVILGTAVYSCANFRQLRKMHIY